MTSQNLTTRIAVLSLLLLTAAASLASACSGSKKMNSKASYQRLTLFQGACFGTCPVYTLELSSDGTLTYDGAQYAPYKGLHHGMVDKDTMATLNALVQDVLAKADDLPKEIETGIVDFAHSRVTIYTATDSVQFRGTTEYAEPVARLREMLIRIGKTTSLTRDAKAAPLPADQLLVTLKAADQIQPLTENYYRQQLKVVRMTTKEPAQFLLSFDPYTMSAEEMVTDMKRNAAVLKVEIVESAN